MRAALRSCRECNDYPCSCVDLDPLHNSLGPSRHNGQVIIEQNELEWLLRSMRMAGRRLLDPKILEPKPLPVPMPFYGYAKEKPESAPTELMATLARAIYESPHSMTDISEKMRVHYCDLGQLLTGGLVQPECIRRAEAWLIGTRAHVTAPIDSPPASR